MRKKKISWKERAKKAGWIYFTTNELMCISAKFDNYDTGDRKTDLMFGRVNDKAEFELRKRREEAENIIKKMRKGNG